MSALSDLIDRVGDKELQNRLRQEVNRLLKQKKFGLVYEEHLPECTPLYDIPVKMGSHVAKKIGYMKDIYTVKKIDGDTAFCVHDVTHEEAAFPLNEIVTVVQFGEPIYPCLKKIDEVCNAPDSDLWHTLIEADNYHALQLLAYLYPESVDCIYIDPPYNTGAKDWKYNNDYVDSSDQYRHSKWLSMMEKRLRLAKKILSPKDSVLIITIDEKEYLHLGCLLEQLFPEAKIQMVTTVISAKGVVRTGQFSRVEEYIYFLEFGKASVVAQVCNMLDSDVKKESNRKIEWLGFRRRAPQATRNSRPNQFYPVFVGNKDGKIADIGDVVKRGIDRNTVIVPDNCTAIWPLSKDGDERLWSLVPSQARANLKKGYLRVKNWNPKTKTGTVYYLPSGTIKDIETGLAEIAGYNEDGSVIAEYHSEGTVPPKRVWNMKSHNAEVYGTNVLNSLIGKRFNYPKSLYAVRDTLGFYIKNKKNALVVDFFSGSGTTLHALNLLNAADNGNRRCIMVTNNEVSLDDAKKLMKEGYEPGDIEWESLGIARHVAWPRTTCSIKGIDVNGQPLKGNYLESDITMANGFKSNAIYFKLGFLDKNAVALGLQFRELLPILWMKAGAKGPCPELGSNELPAMLILPQNHFAVLLEEDVYPQFLEKMKAYPDIETIYFVTDSGSAYRSMIIPFRDKKTYQLYRDYLDNFRINTGRHV